MHVKNCPKYVYFSANFTPFQLQKGMKFSTLFPVHDPSKKAHPQHEIRTFLDAERHEFWERHNYSSLWARETPKIRPRKIRILGTP